MVDPEGNVIEGLYAVGSAAGLTTTGTAYNSGIALGRGLTHAYMVSQELTGQTEAADTASGAAATL